MPVQVESKRLFYLNHIDRYVERREYDEPTGITRNRKVRTNEERVAA